MLPAEAPGERGAAVVAARALTAALLALTLVTAGCGDEDSDDDGGEPGATGLAITLDPDGPGGESARSESIACEADAEASPCATITVADFAPIAPGTACTEIYGGPDEVTISGTVGGEEVEGTFTRANGCEIERFERFTPLLTDLFPGYKPGESLRP